MVMKQAEGLLEQTIFPILSSRIAGLIRSVPPPMLDRMTEIRIRTGKPLCILTESSDKMLTPDGSVTVDPACAYYCSREDIAKSLQLVSRNSLYAYEQELQMGYFTVEGGHRIGVAGQAILESGQLKALKNISSLNIRIARPIPGAANIIMPYVIQGHNKVYNTLIISPPRCGKTTVLRDLTRQLSSGVSQYGFAGVQVGLVDERSEIAACYQGVPTVEVGPRVDILDGCPKAIGMLMLIRSMSPQVIVTDELGSEEDVRAVNEALHAGVSVIASIHGQNATDILHRPCSSELIRAKYFDRYVVLTDKPQVGTVGDIIAAATGEILYRQAKGVKACG
ncbi:stage III sporulation protein AA [Acetonema longum]|uniref:Stage III sporulation protein AA n=1 Tax=Acetonema longum DSM 6540 TaxID=1009370 RepID=F7NJX0_9FIRM|nr:stage III sporulation protein AA [Acetonema longum]EGO63617.1 stage III sporulation protein AA [Acetonema longum DSM 6540]